MTRSPDYVIVDAITVDMVLASASIPLLFPPVEIGAAPALGRRPAREHAARARRGARRRRDRHRAGDRAARSEPPARSSHFGRAVERTVDSFLENAYNVDRKLLLERNRVTRLQGGPLSRRDALTSRSARHATRASTPARTSTSSAACCTRCTRPAAARRATGSPPARASITSTNRFPAQRRKPRPF